MISDSVCQQTSPVKWTLCCVALFTSYFFLNPCRDKTPGCSQHWPRFRGGLANPTKKPWPIVQFTRNISWCRSFIIKCRSFIIKAACATLRYVEGFWGGGGKAIGSAPTTHKAVAKMKGHCDQQYGDETDYLSVKKINTKKACLNLVKSKQLFSPNICYKCCF